MERASRQPMRCRRRDRQIDKNRFRLGDFFSNYLFLLVINAYGGDGSTDAKRPGCPCCSACAFFFFLSTLQSDV